MPDDPASYDRYGVMGYPISHSRSPVIHQLFALQTGQAIRYEQLQVAPEKLEQAVRQFQRTGGRGLNITVPHKMAVAAICDQLSERARKAGAVNTLAFQDGEIFGDNTDGIGLVRDLEANLRFPLNGKRILVLGAGGATQGIVGPMLGRRPAVLAVANRTLSRAEALLERFDNAPALAAHAFDAVPAAAPYDLVVNATSAGLKGESPPYPKAAVGAQTLCYDLSYSAGPTPFVSWARQHNAGAAVMGWGMLVEQAAESFHLWRGVRPDTAPVLKQISVSAS
ncbi:MAG TPA: shikimate dehydrogenase [Woeseiaceae bacterium]|nr:shikimate dehydrogenase [Woeseiaceae bacterium]